MRLTLRTLLAYLDDVLEPADAAELAHKIEDSEFAKGLVQRIRTAGQQPRLTAPGLDGKGVGLDPNTVAEYLDNVLPPDRIPDLERICLESDVHLAEVASCHQILAIVLGEAAEIDPALRDRIYSIGGTATDREDAPEAPPVEESVAYAAVPPPPPPATSTSPFMSAMAAGRHDLPPAPGDTAADVSPLAQGRAAKERARVPEYLRAGQRSTWKPLAITLLLAFLLAAVALRAMGRFDRQHPVLRLITGGENQVAQGNAAAADAEGSPLADSASDTGNGPATEPAAGAEESGEPEEPGVVSGKPKPAADPGEPDEPVAAPGADAASPVPPVDGAAAAEQPGLPAPPAPGDAAEFPATAPQLPDVPAEELADGGPPAAPAAQPPAVGPAAAGPVEVGYVKMKDSHFPIRLDPQDQDWYRLQPRTKLLSGDALRVLPTFGPEIVLAPGVQAVFAGPSSVHLTPPTEQGEPTLMVEYGRVFIATAGVPGARLHLNLDGRPSIVTFVDPASEMALEVRRFLPPGAHPEQDTTQRVVRAFTTIGRIEWQDEASAPPVPVIEGQVRVLVENVAETVVAGQTPAWILREDVRGLDRTASHTLESFLVPDRPITLSLKERVQDRRTEIRALAAICLSHLGHYEALVGELSNPHQRAHWSVEFEALRNAVARDPESAARVRETLQALQPAVAVEAYRLLSGYSPQQLQEGGDEALVNFLDHDSLMLRILAFENLRRITNMTLLYLPYSSEELRRSSVRGWRERLENGAILYDSLPGPTSDRW